MGIFDRLRSRRPEAQPPPTRSGPEVIRVFDSYGRELPIPREEWRTKVLPHNLAAARADPDQLAGVLIDGLQNGFAPELVSDAEQLARTDRNAVRAAILLGVVYMECWRLDDSERVLREVLAGHGDDATVLFNLAKIQSLRGDRAGCDATLWRALEVDPNQENAFAWYTATRRDVQVAQPAVEPCQKVAALPGSWRAQIWLAREALQRSDVPAALKYYDEALANAPQPAPTDLLMQLSGDLGKAGRIAELVERLAPRVSPERHGLAVGNNLLKAYVDLGRPAPARGLLDALFAQGRPDWRETLDFWAVQISRLELEQRKTRAPADAPLQTTMLSFDGPLWTRRGSPFGGLLLAPAPGSPHIAFLGGTVIFDPSRAAPGAQLSDPPGRFSRALPLHLAEELRLDRGTATTSLLPWVKTQGFGVFGAPLDDAEACQLARRQDPVSTVLCSLVVDVSRPEAWRISLRCLEVAGGKLLGTVTTEFRTQELGPATERFVRQATDVLRPVLGDVRTARPDWAAGLAEAELGDYLLRLEQQLAVLTHVELSDGRLSGEHEIAEGALQLCLRNPARAIPRMLYAQTLRLLKAGRPDVVAQHRERWERLQGEHPIAGPPAPLLQQASREIFP